MGQGGCLSSILGVVLTRGKAAAENLHSIRAQTQFAPSKKLSWLLIGPLWDIEKVLIENLRFLIGQVSSLKLTLNLRNLSILAKQKNNMIGPLWEIEVSYW